MNKKVYGFQNNNAYTEKSLCARECTFSQILSHNGLSLLSSIPNKHVIVQLNVPHSPICSYLHLSNLINAIELDPDLASLPCNSLSKNFQMLFICSGYDYISFCYGYGKAAFFNTFFSMHSLLLDSMLM